MDVARADRRAPLAVLMCGIAGSGKTTYARRLESQGFVRLSVDTEVWRRFGRHGVDYPAEAYPGLSTAVEADLRRQLTDLLRSGRDVVVDLSFWRRADRDRYKTLVTAAGGRWRLVYLDADRHTLRRRLAVRGARSDADAAFPISDQLLDTYLTDFQRPAGEGEEVITVTDDAAVCPEPPAGVRQPRPKGPGAAGRRATER